MAFFTSAGMTHDEIRQNVFFRSVVFLAREIVFDIVAFPLWWYSVGFLRALGFIVQEARTWSQRLSLVILFRNLFKPMFGDYTRSGRIISFFMRILVFFFRLIAMVIWLVVLLLFLALYLLAPVVSVALVLRHFFGFSLPYLGG